MYVLNVIGPENFCFPPHIGDASEALWGREKGIRANFFQSQIFSKKKIQHKFLPKIYHSRIKNIKTHTKI